MRQFLGKFIHAGELIKAFKNWPMVFLSYFGFFNIGLFSIGPTMVCTLRNGVKFKVRISIPILYDAAVVRDRSVETSQALFGIRIVDSSTLIDIGAHIGTFSVLAATMASDVRVYAYEPILRVSGYSGTMSG